MRSSLLPTRVTHAMGCRQREQWLCQQRFANALQEGARLLAPKATTIRLPRATLRSEEEVDAWLKTTGAELKEKVKKGPLIIS